MLAMFTTNKSLLTITYNWKWEGSRQGATDTRGSLVLALIIYSFCVCRE